MPISGSKGPLSATKLAQTTTVTFRTVKPFFKLLSFCLISSYKQTPSLHLHLFVFTIFLFNTDFKLLLIPKGALKLKFCIIFLAFLNLILY